MFVSTQNHYNISVYRSYATNISKKLFVSDCYRCTVVLFNPVKSRQHHLLNTSRKTVTCVSFSPDGRYLATGECGHIPNVRVWDLSDNSQVSEFPGHKYGINCVVSFPFLIVLIVNL